MKNRTVEILAPAGSYESMVAAVNAGADAVYIGGSRFGARAYANNLDEETMVKAIDFMHIHGCRIYMTVNTLVKEKEMWDLYSYLTLEGLKDKDITVTVKRDGKKETLTYHPTTEDRYMLGFSYNPDENQAQIQSVTIGGALADAGLQAGDYISAVDGNEVASGEALSQYFEDHPLSDQTVTLTYLRDGLDYDVEVTPQAVNYVEQGFSYNLGREKTSALGVIKYSALEVRYWINSTLEGFKLLITGKLGMDSMSGPVGVVNVIGDAYQESKSEGALMTWLTMINMMILISANLGVANLLPLPALDGGRLVFLLIEAVRGKPVNREAEGMVHFAGLLLLMGLLVFVTFKDVRGLF